MPPPPPPAPEMVHDVTVTRTRKYGCARVDNIPPEEFGITRRQRSVMLRDCDYCFHEVRRTQAELIADGYDKEQIKKLPDYAADGGSEELSRDTVGESSLDASDALNKATRQIRVTEHYVLMDYEGTGKARRYRVTTASSGGEILKRKGKLEIVPDMIRFAAMTPVIMAHRFFGRSVADLVMDIQRIKTALTRAALDNIYFANNQRMEVAQDGATKDTIDDMLANRLGGLVRTQRIGSVAPIPNQPIGSFVFPMIEYMDSVREWRTGVTRQGQGLDPNALQNIGEKAVMDAQSAARAKTKLIARIFAETGVKEMFWLLHATIRQNASQAETVKLRNQWTKVDPQEWRQRDDLTINVGLGTGSKDQEIMVLREIMQIQGNAIQTPKMKLANPTNVYNTLKQLVRKAGLNSIEPYFTDPAQTPEPPPEPSPDEKKLMADTQAKQAELQMKQVEMQMKQQQAGQDMQMRQQQAVVDMQMQQQKAAQELQLQRDKMQLEAQLRREEMVAEQALKREQINAEIELKRQQLVAELDLKERLAMAKTAVDVVGAAQAANGGGTSEVGIGGEPG
jgi:hypothetical protein